MKKFLSMVMALAMTLTLVTVGASAKSFTDDSKITYGEAVSVISSLKVVDGYTDGSFNPTATLTRGAAAKIICNMILGPTTASALGATSAPFSDVPVSNVFAGYITYCAKAGIINGYTDGTFKPAATVTGYQFMKMLLGALGYDGAIEGFTGTNWTIAVAKLAVSIGLDDGNDSFVGSKAMTREEAALYAFNTLKATEVSYESKGTQITINGVVIASGATAAAPVANTLTKDYHTASASADQDLFMQFCEDHFSTLKMSTVAATDNLGFAGNTWWIDSNKNATMQDSEKVGTFDTESVDTTFGAGKSVANIASALGMKNNSTTYTIETYRNGVSKGSTDYTGSEIYAMTDTVPNGVTVDVVIPTDTTDTYRFIYNVTYFATVTGITKDTSNDDVDNRVISLSIKDYDNSSDPAVAYALNVTPDNFAGFDTMWAAVKDVTNFTKTPVYFLVAPKGDSHSYTDGLASDATALLSAVQPTVVSGTINAFSGNVGTGSITVDGSTYKYAKMYATNADFATVTSDNLNTGAVLYTDANGYVYYATAEVSSDTYCSVVQFADYNTTGLDGGTTHQAVLLFTDGSVKTVTLSAAPADHTVVTDTTYIENPDWYTYTINSKGQYVLEAVDAATTTAAGFVTGTSATLTNGSPSFASMTVNNATMFVVRSGNTTDGYTYKAYTGYKAVPSVTGASYVAYATKTAGVASYVFIYAGSSTAVTDSTVKAVVLDATATVTYVDSNTTTYTYSVAVNGSKTTLVSKSELSLTDGYLYAINVDSDGYVVSIDDASATQIEDTGAAGTAFSAATASDGVLSFTATAINKDANKLTAYTYDGSEVVYVVAADGTLSTTSVEGLVSAEVSKDYNVSIEVVGTSTTANSVAIKTIWAVEQ